MNRHFSVVNRLFFVVIRVEDGFTGRLQLFASDTLIVGRECRLDYPSALGLLNLDTAKVVTTVHPLLRVDSASIVKGTVFTYAPGRDQDMAVLKIAQDALVYGQVYAESYGGSAKRYNGNISAISWKHADESFTRDYAFTYDPLSRLTASTYLQDATVNDHECQGSLYYLAVNPFNFRLYAIK